MNLTQGSMIVLMGCGVYFAVVKDSVLVGAALFVFGGVMMYLKRDE